MKKEEYTFTLAVYGSLEELNEEDASLLHKAREVTKNAYAPYSHFRVGAAGRLDNGETITGSNQENASFPVGLCAERVLLATAASLFPGMPLQTLAISYHNENAASTRPITPCGVCRQSLVEYEARTKHSIRLILGGLEGEVYIIEKASMLLPLNFGAEDIC